MKLRMFIASLFIACTAAFAQETASEMTQPLPLDPGTKVGTLPNGLTYYVRHNEYPKGQANFYIAQKVGSALEEDDQRGLAHFLEHMCFNGTKNYPENQVIRYLESIGVKFGEQLNAYTSIDETVYNINNVPVARESTVDSVLLILHDWSHDLTLDPKEIDKERGVIHEEWRVTSSGTMRIFERQLPKLMSESRYGYRLPIGTMEVVDNFKPEALRAYYEKWYRPDQQAIIVVGDIDADLIVKKIENLFNPIPMPENAAAREYIIVPDNDEPIVVSDKDKEIRQTNISVMFKHEPIVPYEYKNSLAGIMSELMLSLSQTMLNDRLAEMTQKPETPFMGASVSDEDFLVACRNSALNISIVPKEGQTDEAIKAVMAEVYRAAKFGFTASEFNRTRSEFLSRIESIYQNRDKRESDSYIQECVQHFINNEPMPGIETEYQLYNTILPQLSVEIINPILPKLLDSDKNMVILAINPDKEGYVQPTEEQLLADVMAVQQMELEAYEDNVKNEPLIAELPAPGSIVKEKAAKFGFTEMTLNNGVKVYMKKTDYKDNEILMNAYSEGGTGRYPLEDKYTLETLGTFISASGLGNFTSTELSKALAGIQASCNPSLTELSEGLSGHAVPKDIRTLFELTYLHFQPLYRDNDAVASAMSQSRQILANRHLSPMTAMQDSVQKTIYGNNPRLVILEAEDLDKASYDRALEIYADRFADASDFSFYFVGNIDEDSIRTMACQYLANLPVVKRKDKQIENGLDMVKGIHENKFRQKQEQPQCYALILAYGKAKNNLHERHVADFLGQVLDMRCMEVIREEMGAAYTTSAQGGVGRATLKDYRASLQIVLPVKPEMCDTALVVAHEILEDIAANGVEDKYLDKIKEYELKTLTEAEHENAAWMGWFRTYMEDGLDSYTKAEESIRTVSSKELADMAKRILKAKNYITVVMMPEE